ncbi:hypothetical protein OG21DRAFT_1500185 [Imleria badia]|nr:hypothetical protein OG21DRAFT_1500185 [Imleria badia]
MSGCRRYRASSHPDDCSYTSSLSTAGLNDFQLRMLSPLATGSSLSTPGTRYSQPLAPLQPPAGAGCPKISISLFPDVRVPPPSDASIHEIFNLCPDTRPHLMTLRATFINTITASGVSVVHISYSIRDHERNVKRSVIKTLTLGDPDRAIDSPKISSTINQDPSEIVAFLPAPSEKCHAVLAWFSALFLDIG